MKKIALLLLLPLLLQSCVRDDVEYHGGTKEVFEGVITDQSGNPIQGIKVSAFVSGGSEANIAGYDFTDSNGFYRMVFPGISHTSDGDPHIALLVNQEAYTQAHNPEYSSFTIHNISPYQIVNHKINFGTHALFNPEDATSLTINFVNTSGAQEAPAVNLIGLVDSNFIDYNRILLDVFWFNETAAGFSVAKNQVVTLLYQPYNFDDSPGIIEEVEIIIGEDPITYTINY